MHGWTEDIRQQQRMDLLYLWSESYLKKSYGLEESSAHVQNLC